MHYEFSLVSTVSIVSMIEMVSSSGIKGFPVTGGQPARDLIGLVPQAATLVHPARPGSGHHSSV
jgi:hypothetical protein